MVLVPLPVFYGWEDQLLNDPLSVTYNGSAKSLPRGAAYWPSPKVRASRTATYLTADREFTVSTVQDTMSDGSRRATITLGRTPADADPFSGADNFDGRNSVSISFEQNSIGYGTATDIPLLRTALLALVDSTLQGRLLGGEL